MKRFLCMFLLICMLLSTLFIVSCNDNDGGEAAVTSALSDTQTTASAETTAASVTTAAATTGASSSASPELCSHTWEQKSSESFACGTKTTQVCTTCNETKTAVLPVEGTEHNFGSSKVCKVCGSDKVTVNGIPLSKFTVVYADNDFSKSLATAIKNKIKVVKGYDLSVKPAKDGEYEYEIIVGDAGRSVAKTFFAKGKSYVSKNYEIIVSDQKIAVAVGSEDMAALAKNRFFDYFLSDKNHLAITDSSSLKGDYFNIYDRVDETDIRITSFNIYFFNVSTTQNETLNQIKHFDTDILCLQEINTTAHNAFDSSIMAMGYALVPGSTSLWTPIFYRADKLTLKASGYDHYDTVGSGDGDSKSYIWVLFEQKSTGKQFIVINTHFSYIDDDYRQGNAAELVAKVNALKAQYGENMTILSMGDLNSRPGYKSFDMMCEALTLVRKKLSIRVKHNTAYGTCGELGELPILDNEGYIIDHFFSSGTAFSVNQYQHIINDEARTVSDHTPVMVDIVLK